MPVADTLSKPYLVPTGRCETRAFGWRVFGGEEAYRCVQTRKRRPRRREHALARHTRRAEQTRPPRCDARLFLLEEHEALLAFTFSRVLGLYLCVLAVSVGLMAICLALFTGGYWLT